MKTLIGLCFLLALYFAPSVKDPSTALKKDIDELLKIHQQDRQAHFRTDADLLLSNHPPDGFISVNQGKISRVAKLESRKRFETYFKNAKYEEWDDLEPPIIRVSKDGTLGWMIVRLRVKRTQRDSSGAEQQQSFVYAGIMTYEKIEGKWTKVANVSTFE